jgi:hypothetical protein
MDVMMTTGEFNVTWLEVIANVELVNSGSSTTSVACEANGLITTQSKCGDGSTNVNSGYVPTTYCSVPGTVVTTIVSRGAIELQSEITNNATVKCTMTQGPLFSQPAKTLAPPPLGAPSPKVITVPSFVERVAFGQTYIVASAQNISASASGSFSVPESSVMNMFMGPYDGRCMPGTTAYYSIQTVLIDNQQVQCAAIPGFTCSAISCPLPTSFSQLDVELLFHKNGDYSGNAVTAFLIGTVAAA